MFRQLKWWIGANHKSLPKRLTNADQPPPPPPPPVTFDVVQEISVYIHRFHNLDLFQQGWYQIKITTRWEEDTENTSPGTPSRVTQYEVPEVGSEDAYGVWKIDDTDNSFVTRPFRIRFARQDVFLSIMVSFNLPLAKYEVSSTSAVILKFELMYTPFVQNGLYQASLNACPAAVHEFRIPPKALPGLHSYCPVYFDALHSVLVDTSVHITLLKAYRAQLKVASDCASEDGDAEDFEQLEQVCSPSVEVPLTEKLSMVLLSNHVDHKLDRASALDTKVVMLVKALIASQNILLNELRMLSKAIDQAIDLTDFMSKLDDMKLFGSTLGAKMATTDGEVSGHFPGVTQNGVEKAIGIIDFQSDMLLCSISLDDLSSSFSILGHQMSCLWNTFLKFQRANRKKILEFLRDVWANDRKVEWSLWMVNSKAELPLQYMSSGTDELSHHGLRSKAMNLRRLTEDPSHSAAMRAELHRQSIALMKINNRSIQDMHIFCDPLQMPVVIVERTMNTPIRAASGSSYFMHLDQKDGQFLRSSFNAVNKKPGATSKQNSRILNVVVFVHGFQGHHLDLRLVRNQWLLIDPSVECLMSEVNEGKTSGDFRDMGERLAQEVISFIKKKMDRVSRSAHLRGIKLSFVGHSIGNIIIRSALSESIMEPYLRYLNTYISISGPHLGYLYSSNSLFNSGLWLLKKLKGAQCIHQLTFTDDPDIYNTFLYKLCKQKTLDSFKNIVLLSSPQDGYVPYHSARIEFCQASLMDYSKKRKAFMEMLNDCLDQIRAPPSDRVFIRCDVNFDTSTYGRNLNTMIGRAAHIEFLESDIFARFIMWSYPELFS